MDGGRDLGVTRGVGPVLGRCWAGVGPVLGLWVLQKVTEMKRNLIGQFVNLADFGSIGLRH